MATSDYRMTTTDAVLRRGIEGRGDDRILTIDPVFQGLPDTAHGGSVLAVFDALLPGDGDRAVRGVYRRRVPLGVPLRLVTARAAGGLDCRLLDASDGLLVDGRVESVSEGRAAPRAIGDAPRHGLPVSISCLACGVDNPLGLRARLGFDDAVVAGRWQPRETLASGAWLAPVAITTLLDEAAFWLGALASGESGMTTELSVTLRHRVPFGTAITVGGRRAAVRPVADDPRYWTTDVCAWDDAGALVAEARVTFVAVRGAARRLAAWLLDVNPAPVVKRVFPAYCP
jgi:hypothetical protein